MERDKKQELDLGCERLCYGLSATKVLSCWTPATCSAGVQEYWRIPRSSRVPLISLTNSESSYAEMYGARSTSKGEGLKIMFIS